MNRQIKNTIDNIFRINLSIKKKESILIFTDTHSDELMKISNLVRERAKKYSNYVKFMIIPPTKCHGMEPPEDLWISAFGKEAAEKLKQAKLLGHIIKKDASDNVIKRAENIIKQHREDAVNAVVALSYFSTSHTRFRDFLNRICGTRYASMPLFDMPMLTGPMMVDWKAMKQRIMNIKKVIDRYELIEIISSNGTFITLSKENREAMTDTGILTKPGSFSNLPAGEVFLAPLEGTASGVLVLNWAPTRALKNPVTLNVENGIVTSVNGDEEYVDFLLNKLDEKPENRNIAELGIGTNDMATRPDNILESEKITGTIHIALGDNSSFGGNIKTPFHQDFVFFNPTVMLSDKSGTNKRVLMKEGELIL